MTKPNPRSLFMASLIILAFGSWWAHNSSLFSDQVQIASKGMPKFFLNGVNSTRFDKNGAKKTTLTFDSAIQLGSKNDSKLIRPKLIFQKSSNSTFTVTSDAGVTKDDETIDLMGNVTLIVRGDEPTSQIGVATDFAVVEIPKQIIKTEYKATITRQNLVGLSRGFIYDDRTGILKLKSTVALTYDD
jgi:LPS export ABC transporter protein LptC